jgi:hypothetical protein
MKYGECKLNMTKTFLYHHILLHTLHQELQILHFLVILLCLLLASLADFRSYLIMSNDGWKDKKNGSYLNKPYHKFICRESEEKRSYFIFLIIILFITQ